MKISIRAIQSEEVAAFRRAMSVPFGFNVRDEDDEPFTRIAELDRMRVAFDGDQIVGTLAAFTKKLTVPGGQQIPMAGTTMVTVLPTHRRRGILRALMLDHLREVPEPIAGLWASESSIYGRFGYGMSAESAHATLPKEFARLRAAPVEPTEFVRLVEIDEARRVIPSLFDAMRAQCPGMISRSESWWTERVFGDPEYRRMDSSTARYAVCLRDGCPVGYVIFRYLLKFNADSVPKIVEMISEDSQAHRALWEFILGIDLATSIEYPNMPVDDPVVWWLSYPRRLERKHEDSLWLRPRDISVCLAARRYATSGTLLFRFKDDQLPDNNGDYQLTVDDAGHGRCERIEAGNATTLALTPFSLGTIFLGAHSVHDLAAGGVITGAPATIDTANAMFAWHRKPWCDTVF